MSWFSTSVLILQDYFMATMRKLQISPTDLLIRKPYTASNQN